MCSAKSIVVFGKSSQCCGKCTYCLDWGLQNYLGFYVETALVTRETVTHFRRRNWRITQLINRLNWVRTVGVWVAQRNSNCLTKAVLNFATLFVRDICEHWLISLFFRVVCTASDCAAEYRVYSTSFFSRWFSDKNAIKFECNCRAVQRRS